MAKIKIGAPLTGIRGTIGGIIYSANKSGPFARAWAMTSNPRTPKQTIERSFLSQMSEDWRSLSDGQRIAWATFAALPAQELTDSLGEAYYASGWNWFVKCNVRLLRLGRAKIKPVPTQARPAAPTIDDFRVCVAGSESDLCVGGVASASSEYLTWTADKAFNDNLSAGDGWATALGTVTGWLQYIFLAPKNIKRYRIYPRDGFLSQAPKNWTFQVWTSGAWETIHTVTDESYPSTKWYDYYCPNPYTETTYRINISANQGDANHLIITEMEMYAADVDASVICYPEDEFDDSTNYDLILHVSLGQTIGKAVQYPRYYETLVTKTPGRWYALIQDELEAVFGTIAMNKSWFCRLYRQTTEAIRSAPSAERTITIGG